MPTETFFHVEARREVARIIKQAIVRIERELREKPARRGVAYHGKVIDTHDRHLRMKTRR